jgi:hypothetical protein
MYARIRAMHIKLEYNACSFLFNKNLQLTNTTVLINLKTEQIYFTPDVMIKYRKSIANVLPFFITNKKNGKNFTALTFSW